MRGQIRMVLTNTDINTFMLSLSFSRECSTEAHTLDLVVEESIKIQDTYNRIKGEVNRIGKYDFSFYYLFNELSTDMELSHYPHLGFCAIYWQKTNGSATWKNYQISNLNLSISSTELESRTKRMLKKDGTNRGLSDRVTQSGANIDPEAMKIAELQQRLQMYMSK